MTNRDFKSAIASSVGCLWAQKPLAKGPGNPP